MVDVGQIVILSLAGLTCLLAVFAIVNEYRANSIERDDTERCKKLARFGTCSAVFCGVLAFAIFGVGSVLHAPQKSQAEIESPSSLRPNDGSTAPSTPPPAPAGNGQPALAQAPGAGAQANTPIATTPVGPAPTFDSGAPAQQFYQPTGGGSSNYSWGSPAPSAAHDEDDHARHEAAEHRPKKLAFPYTPVSYTVVLRFSSEDLTVKSYVDRVVREAERESGIGLMSSSDKFASLRITPTSEVVYADGKQAQLGRTASYAARKDEEAARRYLFNPQISVTVTRENGTRASFSKLVPWAIKKEQGSDSIELYIFPKRKRVILTVTANCQPLQGQFPEGAPSVFDLRGGTVAVQLVRGGDLNGPVPVDLDDVDKHGADESNQLEASMAPRVRSTIVRILCATSPAGSIELGTDDATIERSSLDRETIEVCGPVTLAGFPAEPPG